eukprot:274211-Pelagomonas_calceolata.AAC.1
MRNCKGVGKTRTDSYANHIFGLTLGGCKSCVGSGVSSLSPWEVGLQGKGRAHQMVETGLSVLGCLFFLGGGD